MKEILRRSLTGAVYIILLLSAVFLSSDAFDFLFMTFGLACLYEYKKLVHLKGYHIFAAYLAIWWALFSKRSTTNKYINVDNHSCRHLPPF